jgi:hypothetical protein
MEVSVVTTASTSRIRVAADGCWSPMAHANRNDDSFHDLPPLRRIGSTQAIRDPRVSPAAHRGLGAYTGTTLAVCSYGEPSYPGLVAYDYPTGDVLWTSEPEDLPGTDHRRIAGVLLAQLRDANGGERMMVYAANQVEVIAYDYSGTLVWRTPTSEISPGPSERVGAVTTLTYRDDGHLILTTSRGWVALVSALGGEVVDAYRMDAEVVVAGRRQPGTFVNLKSSVVIDDALYLMMKFRPAHPAAAPQLCNAVFLVRLRILTTATPRAARIEPLASLPGSRSEPPDRIQVGVTRLRGGSPCGWSSPVGNLIFLNSDQWVGGRLVPSVTAVRDDDRGLRRHWQTLLPAPPGDAIRGAPAFHAGTQTLVAPALGTVFVLRNAGGLDDRPPMVEEIPARCLLANVPAGARVTVTSPGALTYDGGRDQVVMCNGFRIIVPGRSAPYSFLASYALAARTSGRSEPLWRYPLAATTAGVPLPGPGTFGQPAMFGLRAADGEERTGVIINSVRTGTHIVRS